MKQREVALAHFRKIDRVFHAATLPHHASLPLELPKKRTRAELFSSLASIVVSQQLGTRAADTIFARLKEICDGKVTPESLLKLPAAKLAKAGLSGSKIKTLKSIAETVGDGSLDLAELKTLPEEETAQKLLAIWGLGPWSVEMFMMFCLGREDVFSSGDLGLVRAMEAIYKLPKGVDKGKLIKIAARWSPHRTYACLLLWRSRDVVLQVTSPGRHRS